MKTIASHDSSMHADDVVGTAVLMQLHPDARIIRTRDPKQVTEADFAVDVGGEWDPARGRFDHHQKGFSGARASGVVYASSGLVWAAHGRAFLRTLYHDLDDRGIDRLHQLIDDELIQHVDMADTGAATGAAGRFGFSMLIDAFNVTRVEVEAEAIPNTPERRAFVMECMSYRKFKAAVAFAQDALVRCAAHAYNTLRSEEVVLSAQRISNGRVLVLPAAGLDWEPVVWGHMPDVYFVVYPDSMEAQFQVRTVRVRADSFDAVMDLPAAWAGLRDGDLVKATGVEDAVFCHNGRFICGARSLKSAIAMAELALEPLEA